MAFLELDMAAEQPLNILIVCEHASNVFGGEAMLPLNYFRLLSKTQHQVYLITHARVMSTIALVKDIDQSKVFYVPDTWAHRFLYRLSRYFPERINVVTTGFLMHLITQFYQWRLARRLVKEKRIHVVHEPAPVSATQPSAMFALGVPVVIGPMNGGMDFPEAFRHMSGMIERTLYAVMRIFTTIYNLLIPGKPLAKVLLVANVRTAQALPKIRLGRVMELVENGVFSCIDRPKDTIPGAEVQVLYVGRLVDWKMVEIVMEAVQRCQERVKLTIVGDGPMRPVLEAMSQTMPLRNIEFTGLVPHVEVTHYYDKADIFVLPSVRECGGAVVLEAMSRGLPTIATDWGGPADYLTAESGFLIKPLSKEYMVTQFASNIDHLARNPELRTKVGVAAIQRVKKHFMWDTKIQEVVSIYHQAITDKNKG